MKLIVKIIKINNGQGIPTLVIIDDQSQHARAKKENILYEKIMVQTVTTSAMCQSAPNQSKIGMNPNSQTEDVEPRIAWYLFLQPII
jgi:hypothetical protein